MQNIGAVDYSECSSKDSSGIQNMLLTAASLLIGDKSPHIPTTFPLEDDSQDGVGEYYDPVHNKKSCPVL